MRFVPALLVLVLAPAGASAAVVSGVVETKRRPTANHGAELYKVLVVTVRAGPGEVNDLGLANPDFQPLVVTDTGTTLTAGSNCVAQSPAVVACSSSEAEGVVVDDVYLGDRDDTFHGDAFSSFDIRPTVAYGGPGDDRMYTSEYMTMVGQGGDDVLRETDLSAVNLDGGRGRDVLRGNSNADFLYPGPGRDDVDGGAGPDTVSYAGTRHPVVIDLSDHRHQPDRMRSIENLEGSQGDDVLLGDRSDNTISGLGGDDRIVGGSGDDDLDGDDGDDRVVGGGGNDFENGGAGRDRVYGNRGDDDVSDYNRGRNVLVSGGRGNDRVEGENRGDVRGGPGDDDLISNTGSGANLFGGAGRDALLVNPTSGTVSCGGAADILTGPFGKRLVPADCERVGFGFVAGGRCRSSVTRLGPRAIRLDTKGLRGKGPIEISIRVGVLVLYDRTRVVDTNTLRLPVRLPASQRTVTVSYERSDDYPFSARLRITRPRRPR